MSFPATEQETNNLAENENQHSANGNHREAKVFTPQDVVENIPVYIGHDFGTEVLKRAFSSTTEGNNVDVYFAGNIMFVPDSGAVIFPPYISIDKIEMALKAPGREMMERMSPSKTTVWSLKPENPNVNEPEDLSDLPETLRVVNPDPERKIDPMRLTESQIGIARGLVNKALTAGKGIDLTELNLSGYIKSEEDPQVEVLEDGKWVMRPLKQGDKLRFDHSNSKVEIHTSEGLLVRKLPEYVVRDLYADFYPLNASDRETQTAFDVISGPMIREHQETNYDLSHASPLEAIPLRFDYNDANALSERIFPDKVPNLITKVSPAFPAINLALEKITGNKNTLQAEAKTIEGQTLTLLRSYNPDTKNYSEPKLRPLIISDNLIVLVHEFGDSGGKIVAVKSKSEEWKAFEVTNLELDSGEFFDSWIRETL